MVKRPTPTGKIAPIRLLSATLLAVLALSLNSQIAKANRLGVNVAGQGLGSAREALGLVGTGEENGGWVVMLGGPNNCEGEFIPFYESAGGAHLVIRAYNGGCAFTPDHARTWAATLANIARRIPTYQKIYFIPWNEPNHPEERVGGGPTEVMTYISTLIQNLETLLLRTDTYNKVVLLSPAIDPRYPVQSLRGEAFFDQFDGIALHGYLDCANPDSACIDAFLANAENRLGISFSGRDLYLPEVGSTLVTYETATGPKPEYDDQRFRDVIRAFNEYSGQNIKMIAPLSYDPHTADHPSNQGAAVNYTWDIFNAQETVNYYNNAVKTTNIEDITTFNIIHTAARVAINTRDMYDCPANSCAIAANETMCGPGNCDLNTERLAQPCQITGATSIMGCSRVYANQEVTQESIDSADGIEDNHPLQILDGVFNFIRQPAGLQEHLEQCIAAHRYRGNSGCRYCSSDECRADHLGVSWPEGICTNIIVASTPGAGNICGGDWRLCEADCNPNIPNPATIEGCCNPNQPSCGSNIDHANNPELMSGWLTRILDLYRDSIISTFSNTLEAFTDSLRNTGLAELIASLGDDFSIADLFVENYVPWDGEIHIGQVGFRFSTTPQQFFAFCPDCSPEEVLNGNISEDNFLLPENDLNRRHLIPGTAIKVSRPGHGLLNQMRLLYEAGSLEFNPYANRGTELGDPPTQAGVIGAPALEEGVTNAYDRLVKTPESGRLQANQAQNLETTLIPQKTGNAYEAQLTQSTSSIRFPIGCTNDESNPCAYFDAQNGRAELYFQLETSYDNIRGVSALVFDITNFTAAHTWIGRDRLTSTSTSRGSRILEFHCCDGGTCEAGLQPCGDGFLTLRNSLCQGQGHVSSVALDVYTSEGGPAVSFYGNPENSTSHFVSCWERSYFGGMGGDNESSCRRGTQGLKEFNVCQPRSAYDNTFNDTGREDVVLDDAEHAEQTEMASILTRLEQQIVTDLPTSTPTITCECRGVCIGGENAGENCRQNSNDCPGGTCDNSRRPSCTIDWNFDFTWNCQWDTFLRDQTIQLFPRLSSYFNNVFELMGGYDHRGEPIPQGGLVDRMALSPRDSVRETTGTLPIAWGWSGTEGRFDSGSSQYENEDTSTATNRADFEPLGPPTNKGYYMETRLLNPRQASRIHEEWREINPDFADVIAMKPDYLYYARRQRMVEEELAKRLPQQVLSNTWWKRVISAKSADNS